MAWRRITDDQLREAVAVSQSVMGVLTHLGFKKAGGTHSHYSRRIHAAGIDTSHFTGQAHNRGKVSTRRKTATQILIVLPAGSQRPKIDQIRRALIESGTPHECACGNTGKWLGRSLTLEIDHVDGDWLNNRIENLRFLCPNCHAQQETTNRPHKNNRRLGVA